MSFNFPSRIGLFALLAFGLAASSLGQELRVCADPDNLPFSSAKKNGFENELAEMVARELHERLTYVWQRMGRGFVRDYITASKCDLLIGIPNHFRAMDTTEPYYRSTYVFLIRKDAAFKPYSLDDPGLRHLHIGVQALDEEYTPPGEVLVKRGMQQQLKAFHSVGGDADDIVRAVAGRQVDVALVWGPLGGYAARHSNELQVIPVTPESVGEIPFTFEISMGVRKGNQALRSAVQAVLESKNAKIVAVLERYGVPQLPILPVSSAEMSSK